MKQENINTLAMKLEKQVTIYQSSIDEIQKLKTDLGKEKETKSSLKKQLTVIQEDFHKFKTVAAEKEKGAKKSETKPAASALPVPAVEEEKEAGATSRLNTEVHSEESRL